MLGGADPPPEHSHPSLIAGVYGSLKNTKAAKRQNVIKVTTIRRRIDLSSFTRRSRELEPRQRGDFSQ